MIVGIIVASAFVVFAVVRRVIHHMQARLSLQPTVSILLVRFWGLLVGLMALLYAFRQLGVRVGPLLGALGIGGLVIAMSLQPVLGNLIGSILLHARRPIRRGDQIVSNGHRGTVIDINGRAVVMMSFDGERVHLPNLKVLDEPLVNQTANDYRRTVVPFQVSYEADLRRTQYVLTQAFRTIEPLTDAPPTDVIVTGFADSGIDMAARVWHPSEELTARWAVSEVAIAIHETLAAEGIEIPLPQLVLHRASERAYDAEPRMIDPTNGGNP